MWTIADWTTAGPYHRLSWLTIAFTIGVIITIVMTAIELRDAYKTYGTVQGATLNEGMLVLSTSTLLRSIGRFGIQIALLVLSVFTIMVEVGDSTEDLYWYRIVFVISLLLTELLLCLSAINDIVARKKLEKYFESHERSIHD